MPGCYLRVLLVNIRLFGNNDRLTITLINIVKTGGKANVLPLQFLATDRAPKIWNLEY